MREKYGVLILRFETFKKQLTEPNKIGHGAFGTVFRCLIPELGNQSYFAVKVLDRDKQKKLSQEECIGNREFFRELEVLALCRHPNIVRVVAVSFDTADLALFYPFVSGGDLENRMAKRPALSGLDRGTIALQLLDAVTYLHASHPDKPCILHRFVFTNNTRMVFICPRRLHRTYLASQRHETCRLPRAPSPPPPARPPAPLSRPSHTHSTRTQHAPPYPHLCCHHAIMSPSSPSEPRASVHSPGPTYERRGAPRLT